MKKQWNNGYISVVIYVKPLVTNDQEEGFISQELFGMLSKEEKHGLQEGYSIYEQVSAKLEKSKKARWQPESTTSCHDVFRNINNVDKAKASVEAMAEDLQAKYGMEPHVR